MPEEKGIEESKVRVSDIKSTLMGEGLYSEHEANRLYDEIHEELNKMGFDYKRGYIHNRKVAKETADALTDRIRKIKSTKTESDKKRVVRRKKPVAKDEAVVAKSKTAAAKSEIEEKKEEKESKRAGAVKVVRRRTVDEKTAKKGQELQGDAFKVKKPEKRKAESSETAEDIALDNKKKKRIDESKKAASRRKDRGDYPASEDTKKEHKRGRSTRRKLDDRRVAGKDMRQIRANIFEDKKRAMTLPRKKAVRLTAGLTVKEFAMKIGKSPGEVLKTIMNIGEPLNINQYINDDLMELVAHEMNVNIEIRQSVSIEESLTEIDKDEDLLRRPPVVTILGHVDHGKTTLLDTIRKSSIVTDEFGGITQHIGAYQIEFDGRPITFIDTPGHESFTAMRARGASITDMAILVVAADDGVMPQTVEALNHTLAANIPVIVAVNKVDKPDANPKKIREQLLRYGMIDDSWEGGGNTVFVDVSAKSGQNIEELLEMILLLTDLEELKANPAARASGVVIESKLEKGLGPVASVLVKRGTLRVEDCITIGKAYGKIRAMLNDMGERVSEAMPSMPVEIIGLSATSEPGEEFHVVENEKTAKQIAGSRSLKEKFKTETARRHISLDDLFLKMQEKEIKELRVIIKGDVQGSVEVVSDSLDSIKVPESIALRIIHSGVGAITSNDVMLASASDAIIIGFNVRPEPRAMEDADREGVEIRTYRVIYQLKEDIEKALVGLLDPDYEEVSLGFAEVRATFKVPKIGFIAGCQVVQGVIRRNASVRVLREGNIIFEGKISSLKRFQDDIKEVNAGYECGIGIEGFQDIKEGDNLEAFEIREKRRESLEE